MHRTQNARIGLSIAAALLALGAPVVAHGGTPVFVKTNLGEMREMIFDGHDLSDPATAPPDQFRMLYAPSEEDDPAYRMAIRSMIEIGLERNVAVDYYDARFGTPDATLLDGYDAVHTWANFPFQNSAAFGDRLGDFVTGPNRKCVILGYGALLANNPLLGAITSAPLCPVFALSTNPVNGMASWDNSTGQTCIYSLVTTPLIVNKREDLGLHANALFDGLFTDGRQAAAYNNVGGNGPSNPPVIYLNGAYPNVSNDDIPCWIASAATCHGIDPKCPEDLNENGTVGFDDLLLILGAWDTDQFDIDGDGLTGFSDLIAVLNAWGTACS